MSLFYGYHEDVKLPIVGGEMKGDIDMSHWAVKNVPAAVDGGDPITKQVLERTYLSEYIKKSKYDTVFNVNIARSTCKLYNGRKVSQVIDGNSRLFQDVVAQAPELTADCDGLSLLNDASLFMSFTCPDFAHPNTSVRSPEKKYGECG